jgi:L-rhamnose mutarotase
MNEYVFFLDLVDDQELIAQYESWHQSVWPEVEAQILSNGISSCKIYRALNRLVLIIHAEEEMDWEQKAKHDANHQKTIEWEELMWNYQRPIPGSLPGSKWQLGELIYQLK